MKKIRRLYYHIIDFGNLGDLLICGGIAILILALVVIYGVWPR